jgi:hypothetical protein
MMLPTEQNSGSPPIDVRDLRVAFKEYGARLRNSQIY